MKRKAIRPEFSISEPSSSAEPVGTASRTLLLAQIATQVVGALTLAVLYRLLHPSDYGLVGAVAPWVMLPRMAATLGLAAALIQLREPSEALLKRLFQVQLRWGGLAATASVLAMPLVAWIWQEERLVWIGAALGGSTFLAALANLHLARLEKEMQMGGSAKARIGGLLCGSAAGILAAVLGAGVWSLVVQQVAELFVMTVIALVVCPWRPWSGVATTNEVKVHEEAARATQRFGLFYSGSQLVNYLGQNLPSLLVPFFLGAAGTELLGLYSQAMSWVLRIVFLVTMPLGSVALASLSKATPGTGAFAGLTERFFRLTAILLFPAALGLWAVSGLLMRLLGGDEWGKAGDLLMILAPAAIGLGLMNLMTPVLSAAGQAKLLFWNTAIATFVVAQGMIAGVLLARMQFPSEDAGSELHWGEGIAYGYTLVTLLVIVGPYLWLGLQNCGVNPLPIIHTCLRPLRSSSLMGVAVWAFAGWIEGQWPAEGTAGVAIKLLASVSLGVALYLVIARNDLQWAYRVLVRGESFLSED